MRDPLVLSRRSWLALVGAAGFAEPAIEEIAFAFRFGDFDDFWGYLVRLAGPLARAIKVLPDEEERATREAISESLSPFREPGGSYALPALCWGVLGR